jgi:hypothetical protein
MRSERVCGLGSGGAEVSSGRCPRDGESKRGAIDCCAKSLGRSRDPQPYSIMHQQMHLQCATNAWDDIIGSDCLRQ